MKDSTKPTPETSGNGNPGNEKKLQEENNGSQKDAGALQKTLTKDAGAADVGAGVAAESSQNMGLIIISFIGVIILAGAFLLSKQLTDPNGFLQAHHCKTIWDVWELAALTWSACFVWYYWNELNEIGSSKKTKYVVTLIVMSVFLPVSGIFFTLGIIWKHDHWYALMCGCALSFVYYTLDYILSHIHKDEIERKNYLESFWLADVPIVITNIVLFVWLIVGEKPEEWETFAGGIIAAQLITCNLIFVITQSKIIRNIWNARKTSA
ncbi:MAG: hypothetical protein QM764_20630 [Chitinophagaceae bacterium]